MPFNIVIHGGCDQINSVMKAFTFAPDPHASSELLV